jgi:cell division protein FtsI/penicillin-binding protein 2
MIPLLLLAAASLPEQSIGILIDRAISDPRVSYLVLDTRTGQVIAGHWQDPKRPIPVGSLVKPFTALTYGETHAFRFPEYTCRTQCWLPGGHGRLNLEQAIAHSCNSYFRELAKHVDQDAVSMVCRRLGLPLPSSLQGLTGMGAAWNISPLDLALAFGQLAHDPDARAILAGMRQAAQFGTAKAVGRDALAKTGTAECSHVPREAGDGFAVVLFPAEAPRYTVLVRKHGTTGANAAVVAGHIRILVQP